MGNASVLEPRLASIKATIATGYLVN